VTGRRVLLGVLLAGGASTRFGSPKWKADVGGISMAERGLAALRGATDRVRVVGSDPDLETLGVPVRGDRTPGLGPLEGIAVALAWAREEAAEGALVLACDLPLVTLDVLASLVDAWSDEDAVVPERERGIEPLCALYSVRFLPRIEEALARGERSPTRLLGGADARVLRLASGSDDSNEAFVNVNTTRDRDAAEEALRHATGSEVQPR
jgi:molybdenum cofactor guanylyltransferase